MCRALLRYCRVFSCDVFIVSRVGGGGDYTWKNPGKFPKGSGNLSRLEESKLIYILMDCFSIYTLELPGGFMHTLRIVFCLCCLFCLRLFSQDLIGRIFEPGSRLIWFGSGGF